MRLQAFFCQFSALFDAPNGVAQIRELVLQLAVRGQLYTQNPNDDPASSLLYKIGRCRAQLIKEKQIRTTKPLPAIQSSEIPFNIPQNWQWIRLGEIGDWGAGATPNRKDSRYYGGDIRWFKSGELNDGRIRESEEGITQVALKECSLRLNRPGDVLIAMYGATIGKLAILETEATTNQAVCACTCFDGFDNQYLFLLLRSYKKHFSERGAGGAQPNISREKIIHTVAPLPPLEEQKRIVERVEELMVLCDELKERQQAKRESRARLNTAVLAPLNKAASLTPEEFEHATTRLADNFDTLYDSIDTVSKLRATILHLAVQGKLVAQDPNDEPASVLLQEIKQEQKRLLKEGKIKGIIDLPSIDLSSVPFELPVGWTWSRFPELGEFNRGRSKHRPRNAPELYVGGQYKFVQTGDVARANGTITTFTGLYNEAGLAQSRMWPAGTMCITIAANIADSGILGFDACFPDSVVGFVPSSIIGSAQYFEYFMRTAKSHLQDFAPSTAQKNINISILQQVLIPLPPLAERERIVAKVNQLMSLCDELEDKLRQAEADREKLMNAAVKHVLDSVRDVSKIAKEVFA